MPWVLLLPWAVLAASQPEPVRVEAEQAVYVQAVDELTAEGQVKAESGEFRLQADRAVYRPRTHQLDAEGAVHFRGGGIDFIADAVSLDLQRRAGRASNAVVRGESEDGGFFWEGASVERIEEGRWMLEEARGTTCRCADPGAAPPWSVETGRVQLREQGYAVCDDLVFRIFDVPVVYLPWMVLPARSEPNSGLLTPRVGYSNRKGFLFAQPLHLVAGKRSDLTFTPRMHSQLGPGVEAEGRWSLGGTGYGWLRADWQDLGRREGRTDIGAVATRQRYALGRAGLLHLGGQLSSRVGYRRWMGDGLGERLLPYESMRAFWRLTSSDAAVSMEGAAFVVRQGLDVATSDRSPEFNQWRDDPHSARLPRLNVHLLPHPLVKGWPLYGSLEADAQAVNDRTALSSQQGTRAMLSATLSGGWRLGDAVEMEPFARVRQVWLESVHPKHPSARLSEGRLGVESRVGAWRIFSAGSARWRHRAEWALGYQWEEDVRRGEFPEWDLDDARDPWTGPYLAFSNHVHRKSSSGGEPALARRWFHWRLVQSMDPEAQPDRNRAVPLRSEAAITALPWLTVEGDNDWDWHDGRARRIRVEAEARGDRGDRVEVAYRRREGLEALTAWAELRLGPVLGLFGGSHWDFRRDTALQNDGGLVYNSRCDCWTIRASVYERFRPDQPGREVGGRLELQLTGLGAWD